jgi:hypothetical protein
VAIAGHRTAHNQRSCRKARSWVAGFESRWRGAGVVQVLQDGFFSREVGFEVLMGDGRAGMTEPEGYGGQVGACKWISWAY